VEHLSFDVLVVGSGAAGLRAAIAAREKGLEVGVISKAAPGKSTCTMVSGGAFTGTREGDSPQGHMEQTLRAGRGVNLQKLVEILVTESPQRLKELVDWGIKAKFHKGSLYASGRPPIWGEEIVRCLLSKNKSLGTLFMGGLLVTDLKMHAGQAGVICFSTKSNRWLAINANAVVLATGGAGALYRRHDNPKRMLGDGYVLALKAGAVLQDMEFVQFYPLGLAEPGMPPFLIPPRIADSGKLYNNRGEDILAKYKIHERPAGVRARDKLSQAFFKEIYRFKEEIWLDLRGATEDDWQRDPFSASTRELFGERYGAMHRPLRIAPLAHHVMGGVCIDPDGATSVPGLYAAGEITGGLHGANRMGGNALTETVVFGARAGASAAAWANENSAGIKKNLFKGREEKILKSRQNKTKMDSAQFMKNLREILWTDGGIIRNKQGLNRALDEIEAIRTAAFELGCGDHPRELQRNLELQFACQTAALILQTALQREESRGAHFREDYPDQDDEKWRGHLQVRLFPQGEPVWSFIRN
jgi:succinate dehydrogenase/fumarate reductase flavoprotein subunit